MSGRHYQVNWIEEDNEFAATVNGEPHLSYMDADPVKALTGLVEILTKSEFKVGDIITTQEEAERLPMHTIVLSVADDPESVDTDLGDSAAVALQLFYTEWLETGREYAVSPIEDYLPAKIVWLPHVAVQGGAL